MSEMHSADPIQNQKGGEKNEVAEGEVPATRSAPSGAVNCRRGP